MSSPLKPALARAVLAGALAVARVASAADLLVGGAAGARQVVVPDAAWMSEAAWTGLPDRNISSWFPEHQNMTYFGARLLQEYFRKITGAELTVVNETDWERAACPDAVIVGPTRFACRQFGARLAPQNLRRSGYVAKSVPGRLLICGVTPWATYGGCATVLEEYAGVEWFWPTELGEEVPQRPELKFDRIDVTFEPAIAFHSGMLGEWGPRVGERLSGHESGEGHSLGPYIFHAGRTDRPEWFPLLDGERVIPGPSARDAVSYWQPCMASPATLERAVAVVAQRFRDKPYLPSFSLGLNDGVWRGCECAYCLAADGDPDPAFATVPYHYNGRYTRRYYAFLEHVAGRIARDFPGKLLTTFAYSGTDIPPADARPIPNLALALCSTKLAWLNPELRKWEELRHKLWARLTPYPGSYDYMYQTGYIPMYAPHLYADVNRFLWTNGYASAYAETYQTMARAGPKYWVHVKLCNNPTLSVDALLDKWMRGMFKEAAAPMAEFYNAIEQAWTNYPYHARNTDGWSTYCFCYGADLPVLTPAHLTRMDASLAQAESLARDPRAKARLAVVRKNYLPTRAMAELLWRCRPYRDPVPFDDAVVLQELKDHDLGVPPFDFLGYYDANCTNDLLSEMRFGKEPPAENSAERRLGRVVDGIVAPVLTATNGAALRQAIARRAEELAGKAAATPATRARLVDLSGRCVSVGRAAAAPRLDGALDDACWQAAEAHEGFWVASPAPSPAPPKGQTRPPLSGVVPPSSNAACRTSFRLCHDGRVLYVAARCAQRGLSTNDGIVITLEPWQGRHSGGPQGTSVTLTAGGGVSEDGLGYGTTYWHARARSAVRVEDDGYTLEAAIPFMAFLFSPQNDPACRFNLERRAQGKAGAEHSAWYPPALGLTWARFGGASAQDLLQPFAAATTAARDAEGAQISMSSEGWNAYPLTEPTGVEWLKSKGGAVRVVGGRTVLIAQSFLPVQSGHRYDIRVDRAGRGTCSPSLDWYRRASDGYIDVLEAGPLAPAARTAASRDGDDQPSTVVAPLTADAARFRILCSGEVQVTRCRVSPRLPLDVRVDVDTDTDRLVTGHVLGLQAAIRNLTDHAVTGLCVRLAFPAGVDRRAEAVTAAPTLAPGATTHAMWWLTPVYAVGQADFTVVTEAHGMPRIVTQVRGPIPKERK